MLIGVDEIHVIFRLEKNTGKHWGNRENYKENAANFSKPTLTSSEADLHTFLFVYDLYMQIFIGRQHLGREIGDLINAYISLNISSMVHLQLKSNVNWTFCLLTDAEIKLLKATSSLYVS